MAIFVVVALTTAHSVYVCADNSFNIKGLTNLLWKLNDAIFVLFIGDGGITNFICSPGYFHERVGKVTALLKYYVFTCARVILCSPASAGKTSVCILARFNVPLDTFQCQCRCVCVGCAVVSVRWWSNSSLDAQTATTRNRSFAQVSTRKVSTRVLTEWAICPSVQLVYLMTQYRDL